VPPSSGASLTRISRAQPLRTQTPGRALHRLFQPRENEPRWARPALIAIALLAGALMLVDVTRSAYGNPYYAAGALAASHSWSALFNNAADLSGYVSLDKGPLPDWIMGLSGRLLGFGSLSVMLPNALCGTATVLVLHDAVRRALGHQIAIVAALLMAITPVAVLVGRYNTPDGLLLLLLVCAARSLTRAVQGGRTRDLLLCGVFVGLAFNTKMLEAYVVLPALALPLLVARREPMLRRLRELAVAAAAALLVSVAWFGTMMLLPASDRPYVSDTPGNSWFQLIFEGNGFRRIAGQGGAFGQHLESQAGWLFTQHIAGQISWLLPLALVGLLFGLVASWSSRGSAPAFNAYLLWGTWALVGCGVLSFSAGIRHAYYTSILAPAVATLAAAALVAPWRAVRESPVVALATAFVVGVSAIVSYVLLAHSGVPWLRWVVLAFTGLAFLALVAPHLLTALRGTASMTIAIGATSIALLAGPAAYSLATVGRAQTGYDPVAGPAPPEGKRVPAKARRRALSAADSLALLIPYLVSHRAGARYLVAATDARTAAPIALATTTAVITVGGFLGADPTPTAPQIVELISSGQLRYVLLDSTREFPASRAHRFTTAPEWVIAHCSRVPYASLIGPGSTERLPPGVTSTLTLFACAATASTRP
jgi:4-amino-4-deoxy-L-arabinose transferase-like glycosyltransferase